MVPLMLQADLAIGAGGVTAWERCCLGLPSMLVTLAGNQRGVMEFHLINHPVDCAICDQSGECKLQDYYMEYDHQPSRIRTYKLNKPKREVFGPMVVYDAERCIMCTRCVRFMDEVAKAPQLAVIQRGSHSLISTFPGQPLDSAMNLNGRVGAAQCGALPERLADVPGF